VTTWLIDKSALVRLNLASNSAEWSTRITRGLVRISTLTMLEAGFSARSADDLRNTQSGFPLNAMPVEYLTPAIEDRSVIVQQALADAGLHRAASIPDPLIAATAELAGLTVLHVDKDFEIIAGITGQSVERLKVPRA